jgi:hypothetical protein
MISAAVRGDFSHNVFATSHSASDMVSAFAIPALISCGESFIVPIAGLLPV